MPDSMERRMARAARRKGASTLSPVSEDASRKWRPGSRRVNNAMWTGHGRNTRHSLQPIGLPQTILPLVHPLYPTCFLQGRTQDVDLLALLHQQATEKDS